MWLLLCSPNLPWNGPSGLPVSSIMLGLAAAQPGARGSDSLYPSGATRSIPPKRHFCNTFRPGQGTFASPRVSFLVPADMSFDNVLPPLFAVLICGNKEWSWRPISAFHRTPSCHRVKNVAHPEYVRGNSLYYTADSYTKTASGWKQLAWDKGVLSPIKKASKVIQPMFLFTVSAPKPQNAYTWQQAWCHFDYLHRCVLSSKMVAPSP